MSRIVVGSLVLFLAAACLADDKKATEPNPFGTWRQVAVVVDGMDIPAGRATLLTVTRDGYSVTIDGQPYQKGTSKVVGGEDVRKIDVVVTEGANAGATIPQISRIEGDVLIACQAKPGEDRPTTFTSKPGSGHILSVWLRTK